MHRYRIKHMKAQTSKKSRNRFRFIIQLASALLFNGYFPGFIKGTIYTGSLKNICVPVLNCYSCPGALGSCPIGALQAVIGGAYHKFSFYVIGTLMLFGTVLGRLICGFTCPFGFIQDLLHKIPVRKFIVPANLDRIGRYVKYAILFFMVFLLPLLITDEFGMSSPFFCKYLCPAGTLEGGIFHVLTNSSLQKMAGLLFSWKVLILILIIAASVFISRFFCRYLCPLGAFYSLFNRFSIYHLQLDHSKCTGCKSCEKSCPMSVNITRQINSAECIRCGICRSSCPTGAIKSVLSLRKSSCSGSPQDSEF